jgi:prepilin-type N-terminal cleavage/methylation domain-containing protein
MRIRKNRITFLTILSKAAKRVKAACYGKSSFRQYNAGVRDEQLTERFYFNSHSRAFTFIELIVTVAIIGFLAAVIIPRMSSWIEPHERTLQRAFLEAVDIAKDGVSIRFRIDKEEKRGTILPEVLVREEEGFGFTKRTVSVWKAFEMKWKPTGNAWTFDPEIIYFYQNGMCTPAKITWGVSPYVDKYLLTVTGFLVERKGF